MQDAYDAAAYVATVTLSSLGELFSSANQIMQWLATCASLVSKQGQPMAWVRSIIHRPTRLRASPHIQMPASLDHLPHT